MSYLLAVIMPVYNAERYLREAVDSVVSQKNEETAMIIIDDGSTDDSLQIARSEAGKTDSVFILTQQNSGAAVARNNGIEKAVSIGAKYIAFLDSDDVWMPNIHEFILNELRSEQLDVLSFSYFKSNEALAHRRLIEAFPMPENGRINKWGLHFCSFIYKTDIISRYNVRFPEGIHHNEDEAFRFVFLSIAKAGKRYDKPLFIHRSHNSSITHRNYSRTAERYGYVVKAWEWAESEIDRLSKITDAVDSSEKSSCRIAQRMYIVEFINVSMRSGMTPSRIRQTLAEKNWESILNDDSIWLSDDKKSFLNSYKSKPVMTFIKYRLNGLIYAIGRKGKAALQCVSNRFKRLT